VAGLGARAARNGRGYDGKLVYAMRVDEVIPFDEYDLRFTEKRPDLASEDPRRWVGDNLYDCSGRNVRQRDGAHDREHQEWDLSGRNVLVSRQFAYLGSEPEPLPFGLRYLSERTFRNYTKWGEDVEEQLVQWLLSLPLEWNVPMSEPQLWPPTYLLPRRRLRPSAAWCRMARRQPPILASKTVRRTC